MAEVEENEKGGGKNNISFVWCIPWMWFTYITYLLRFFRILPLHLFSTFVNDVFPLPFNFPAPKQPLQPPFSISSSFQPSISIYTTFVLSPTMNYVFAFS